jgi:hypothetical protein
VLTILSENTLYIWQHMYAKCTSPKIALRYSNNDKLSKRTVTLRDVDE